MISVCLLGGMSAYMQLKSQRHAVKPTYEPPPALGIYSLELTPNFSAEKDPFALDIGDTADGPALVELKFGKRVLLAERSAVKAGHALRVDSVEGIRVGKNQFHVSVAVPADKLTGSHAVRIRILRDDVQVADQTLWSEPGHPVSGEVTLDVAPLEEESAPHDHD